MNESAGKLEGVISRGQQYKKIGPRRFLQRVIQPQYRSERFEEYVKGARELDCPAGTGEEALMMAALPSETNFEKDGVYSELLISQVLIEWIFGGAHASWLGNPRRVQAAMDWLRSDDNARRNAVLQTESSVKEGCPLAGALISLYGKNYKLEIQKLPKRLEWISRAARQSKSDTTLIGPKEAIYLDDLLMIRHRK